MTRMLAAAVACPFLLGPAACSSAGPPAASPPAASPQAPPVGTDRPPASAGHSLVYAQHLGTVVLVNAGLGGAVKPPASTPTRVWGWTGGEWRLLDASGPPIRNLAGVTYDTRRRTLVMHGGSYDLGRSYGDTWEWSAGWRQVAAPGPGVRDHTQLAFDSERDRAVLFGGSGEDPNVAFGDTWEFDGTSWSRVATAGPPARIHHAMHYDPVTRRVVAFGGAAPGGGTLADTWAWDGRGWAALASAMRPRSHARMTFHRGLGGLVVVGGLPQLDGLDMLVSRGEAWMPLPMAPQPPPRYLTDVAYDEARSVLVLFGGGAADGSLYDDTWELDATGWRRIR